MQFVELANASIPHALGIAAEMDGGIGRQGCSTFLRRRMPARFCIGLIELSNASAASPPNADRGDCTNLLYSTCTFQGGQLYNYMLKAPRNECPSQDLC